MLDETRIRLDAIQYVRVLRERWVAVPAAELREFASGGERVFLKGQQGVFKPAELSEPLSLTSTLDSSYTRDPIEGSRVLYDFVRDHENDGLKRCADAELPLIYLLQVKRKPNPEYVVFAPVYVIGWDDETRRFLIDLSEQPPTAPPKPISKQLHLPQVRSPESPSEVRELTTTHVLTTVQRRLQQARERNDVLAAFRDRCAVCGLHIRALLDARDGLALCPTHLRAFEAKIFVLDAESILHVELPAHLTAGEGEERMLLAFEGKRLERPEPS